MLKKIGIALLIIAAIGGYFAWEIYKDISNPNVPDQLDNEFVLIPDSTTFDQLLANLKANEQLIDHESFVWVAEKMNYKKEIVRSGRFKIKPGWSNRQLVRHLRSGAQATVRIVLHNERLVSDLAGKLSKSLRPDSLEFLKGFQDVELLNKFGYTPQTIMSLFIPNSYDFYWNSSPEIFLEKMKKENEKFWSANRREKKAEEVGLSKLEVYTLASIIMRETNAPQELPTIAGLYQNRLKKGMLLQADPTVVFATGKFDLRRVLKKHLAVDSPYNTYKYPGLPPGPISMATISSIDAVLSPDKHDYIFFCAKPDNSGLHAFAKTLSGHNANARKFHAWLNKRGIR